MEKKLSKRWEDRRRAAYKRKPGNVLYGLQQIADYFGLSQVTIHRWILRGFIPAMKDPKGRWFISIDLINSWIIAGNAAELEAKGQPRAYILNQRRVDGARELTEKLHQGTDTIQ